MKMRLTVWLIVLGGVALSLINVPQQKAHAGAVLRQYQAVLETAGQVYDGDTLSDIVIKIAAFETSGEVWPEIFITDEGVFTRFTLLGKYAGCIVAEVHVHDSTPARSSTLPMRLFS